MADSIPQLKSLWSKECELYKTQEVGSGVHRFVMDILRCSELFNLNEGKLTTPLERRKNEFVHEHKTKEGRQADFAIFIDSDIVIPLEAEQYTKIQKGEGQLAEYQSDLDKKYGILTDGYTWRFYNNNIYRKFTLDKILSEPDYFLEFWHEYIKPEYYYLSFFEEVGQKSLFDQGSLAVEHNRELFFNDITRLIRSFRNKLSIAGYFESLDKKEAEKKATEITYAYIIQFILYKTLSDNKFEEVAADYQTRIRSLHSAIKSRSYNSVLGLIDGISARISENIYRPFLEEQKHIEEKMISLIRQAKSELSDVSPWLDIIVFIKKYDFQNIRNDIFGFIYENYLKELYADEKRGQFFTDPTVVNFMLQQAGYTAKEISAKIRSGKLDTLSLVDPACGSGTFLYSAAGQIVQSLGRITKETSKQAEDIVTANVYGLDIEEFPLYLAEMSILMRMLHLIVGEKYNNPLDKKIKVFLTKDSIAEFIGSGLERAGTNAPNQAGQSSFMHKLLEPHYSSYMRDEADLTEMKTSTVSFPRRRFDYVIGNPPYVSYNECSKRGLLIFDLLKKHRVKLNDIYGVNLHSVPGNPKHYRPNPNLYAFFIALGLALLKDDGCLCFIIPQTFLVNADFDVLRYHLAKLTSMKKIVTFSGKMFIGRGLQQTKAVPTSSLIFVTSRALPPPDNEVELVNYRGADEDLEKIFHNISKGINTTTKKIKQIDLANRIDNWNFIKLDALPTEFLKVYMTNSADFSTYYTHTKAKHTFGSSFIFDGGYSIDERKLLSTPASGVSNYECPRLNDKYWTIRYNCGFWPNERDKSSSMFIALRQGNQGYSFLDAKYKLIWSYNATDRFYYTDRPVIWARNKLLGIASNDRKEILYLFALLNSGITKFLLDNFVKIEQEETRTILVSLQIVKTQLRVPNIIKSNASIKDAIIGFVDQLLNCEGYNVSDFVDFSGVLLQKFDDVETDGDKLILIHDGKKVALPITNKVNQVCDAIARQYTKTELQFEKRFIDLHELRNLEVLDAERQSLLKRLVDDLVFSMYFAVDIPHVTEESLSDIRDRCSKNPFYKLLQP